MITITTSATGAPPEVTLNGQPLNGRHLSFQDSVGDPFARVYLDAVRQFDCEIWIDGSLRHVIPRESSWSRVAYEQMEHPEDPAISVSPPDAVGDSLRPQLDPILAEMKNHPGSEIIRSWQALHAMWSVHELNTTELCTLIDNIASDPMLAIEMVQNVRPPVVRQQLTAQIDQKLHNYVASSASLIEQTRRLADRYVTVSVRDDYDRRRSAITTQGRNVFLRDLRNYALHYSIPFTRHTVSLNAAQPELTYRVDLSTSSLSEWAGWKAPAKEFLAEAGPAVDLRAVVAEHAREYKDLWGWLFAQERALSRLAVVARDEFAAEHDWILTGGAQGAPRRDWAIAPSSELRFLSRT